MSTGKQKQERNAGGWIENPRLPLAAKLKGDISTPQQQKTKTKKNQLPQIPC